MFFKPNHSRRAFTLVELLITITLFSAVAVICANLLVNTLRTTRRVDAQVFLYTETQNLLDQLSRDIEKNTIDYEAYYSRTVLAESGWHTPSYGLYGQSFYDPGDGGGPNPGPYGLGDGYGVYCADGGTYPDDCPSETPDSTQQDFDTGAHPFPDINNFNSEYNGEDPSTMSALCESDVSCAALSDHLVNELILINGGGDERTIFVREALNELNEDFTLSRIQMQGSDTDNDGLVDAWECRGRYSCGESYTHSNGTEYSIPDENDLVDTDSGDEDDLTQNDFMPLSPSPISIESFYVLLGPSEDPYRAFSEPDVQVQPQVTIIMTVSLSNDYAQGLIGDVPSITVQRTVSTGVYREVESYE